MMARRSIQSLIRRSSVEPLKRYLASSAQDSASSSSSSSPPSSWKPPIAPGVEPAYDEALKYISTQQAKYKQKIPAVEEEIRNAPSESQERLIAEMKLKSLIIASQIDDPEIRWRFANNVDVNLKNPVFAHLREKTWRTNVLPRLMERIRLMNVLPDAIPYITPAVDLQIAFGTGDGIGDHGGEGGDVIPGCFVPAEKTTEAPIITATPFHDDEKLYTIATVDLDYPYEKEERLGTFAHWIVQNVPLSITKSQVDPEACTTLLPYIPSHPQKGTKYHRYVTILFSQSTGQLDDLPMPTRENFSLQGFAKEYSLTSAGIHFWRSEWTKEARSSITSIYRNILQKEEPLFVRG